MGENQKRGMGGGKERIGSMPRREQPTVSFFVCCIDARMPKGRNKKKRSRDFELEDDHNDRDHCDDYESDDSIQMPSPTDKVQQGGRYSSMHPCLNVQ